MNHSIAEITEEYKKTLTRINKSIEYISTKGMESILRNSESIARDKGNKWATEKVLEALCAFAERTATPEECIEKTLCFMRSVLSTSIRNLHYSSQLDQLEAISRVQNLNDICEDLKAEISEK